MVSIHSMSSTKSLTSYYILLHVHCSHLLHYDTFMAHSQNNKPANAYICRHVYTYVVVL